MQVKPDLRVDASESELFQDSSQTFSFDELKDLGVS